MTNRFPPHTSTNSPATLSSAESSSDQEAKSPTWCHAHHVTEKHTGGPTNIDNGVLLCAAYHHMLHASDYRFTMRGGVPHLTARKYMDPTQTARRLRRHRAVMKQKRPG